ncbi:MvdC/MvdD family ATP grasp protein [Streptomyces syringium]|uniref:MvdC/MvdD family ATP grasp protein n=1 Tax=Streptomyces syringium TaxID=76729 RepID=UPI0036B712E7
MTVLVLTRPEDATADLVIAELNERRVPVWRLDPGDFPGNLSVSARLGAESPNWCGTVQGQHRGTSLDRVRSVYYRRPSPFRLNPALSQGDARWAQAEARAGIGGLLTSLDCLWVNHPHRNAVADVGPAALATASRCGLAVPETLITNSASEARAFVKGLPGGGCRRLQGNRERSPRRCRWLAPGAVDQQGPRGRDHRFRRSNRSPVPGVDSQGL